MRKSSLEGELGSKIFYVISKHPEGIWAYYIAKIIYEKDKNPETTRVYEKLKTMRRERLVEIKEEKIERGKTRKLYKVNMGKVVEVIDSRLSKKFTEREKLELKKFLESEPVRKLDLYVPIFNYIGSLCFFLQSLSTLVINLKMKEKFDVWKSLSVSEKEGERHLLDEAKEMSDSLLSKLTELENPVPFFKEIFMSTIGLMKNIFFKNGF